MFCLSQLPQLQGLEGVGGNQVEFELQCGGFDDKSLVQLFVVEDCLRSCVHASHP